MKSASRQPGDHTLVWPAIAAGSALLILAIWRRPLWAALATGVGLWLAHRDRSCADRGPAADAISGQSEKQSAGDDFNAIDQASWESFPASDPPASHQITS